VAVAHRLFQWLNVVIMKSATKHDENTSRFWVRHPDSTQAAVHLALQWLAFVYPTSAPHLDATLHEALPYADDELSSRWAVFLEEKDVDEHVEALRWLSLTLSKEQLPFLIESCWRLLLVNHDLPSHVPLALRLLGRVLKVPEFHILDIGKKVEKETEQLPAVAPLIPLLPEDPRYLDRVEWRLYGMSDPIRRTSKSENSPGRGGLRLAGAFAAGLLVGIGGLSFLVWGPPQMGREPIPRMSHQNPSIQPTQANTGSVQGQETPLVQPQSSSTDGDEAELATGGFDQSTLPEADPGSAEALTVPSDASAAEVLQENARDTEVAVVAVNADESPAELTGDEPPAEVAQEAGEPAGAGEPVADQPDVMMRITASLLNVRAAPSTNSDIIIKLGEGARVWMEPEGSGNGWNRIRVEGLVGYASSNFMEPVN
jgi:hypothetical protein